MQIQKLPKIQVTVTTTATTLEDLLTTANGGTALSGVVGDRNEINAITFQPEAEVRYSGSGTPTTAIGQKIGADVIVNLRGPRPGDLQFIAGGNVLMNVELGRTNFD